MLRTTQIHVRWSMGGPWVIGSAEEQAVMRARARERNREHRADPEELLGLGCYWALRRVYHQALRFTF